MKATRIAIVEEHLPSWGLNETADRMIYRLAFGIVAELGPELEEHPFLKRLVTEAIEVPRPEAAPQLLEAVRAVNVALIAEAVT